MAAVDNPANATRHQHCFHKGFALWLTGLSGSGKTTLAQLLEQRLQTLGAHVEVLDGDVLRSTLCFDLDFSKEGRQENNRRIGVLCESMTQRGVITIVAAISPYRVSRDEVRARIPQFLEVYMSCPLDVLIARDVKGLYRKALNGEIAHFTGISDPYEPPLHPELIVDSSRETADESARKVVAHLEHLGWIAFSREHESVAPAG